MEKLGLFKQGRPPLSEQILLASGVPKSKVVFLPEPAEGTMGEARLVKNYLKGEVPSRLVLITSPWAYRWARFIFRMALRTTGGEVFAYPTPYESFSPQRWWAKPSHALTVVMEFHEFFVNAFQAAFEGVRG